MDHSLNKCTCGSTFQNNSSTKFEYKVCIKVCIKYESQLYAGGGAGPLVQVRSVARFAETMSGEAEKQADRAELPIIAHRHRSSRFSGKHHECRDPGGQKHQAGEERLSGEVCGSPNSCPQRYHSGRTHCTSSIVDQGRTSNNLRPCCQGASTNSQCKDLGPRTTPRCPGSRSPGSSYSSPVRPGPSAVLPVSTLRPHPDQLHPSLQMLHLQPQSPDEGLPGKKEAATTGHPALPQLSRTPQCSIPGLPSPESQCSEDSRTISGCNPNSCRNRPSSSTVPSERSRGVPKSSKSATGSTPSPPTTISTDSNNRHSSDNHLHDHPGHSTVNPETPPAGRNCRSRTNQANYAIPSTTAVDHELQRCRQSQAQSSQTPTQSSQHRLSTRTSEETTSSYRLTTQTQRNRSPFRSSHPHPSHDHPPSLDQTISRLSQRLRITPTPGP